MLFLHKTALLLAMEPIFNKFSTFWLILVVFFLCLPLFLFPEQELTMKEYDYDKISANFTGVSLYADFNKAVEGNRKRRFRSSLFRETRWRRVCDEEVSHWKRGGFQKGKEVCLPRKSTHRNCGWMQH